MRVGHDWTQELPNSKNSGLHPKQLAAEFVQDTQLEMQLSHSLEVRLANNPIGHAVVQVPFRFKYPTEQLKHLSTPSQVRHGDPQGTQIPLRL